MPSFLSKVIVLKIASFVRQRGEGRAVNNRLSGRGCSEGRSELGRRERGVELDPQINEVFTIFYKTCPSTLCLGMVPQLYLSWNSYTA